MFEIRSSEMLIRTLVVLGLLMAVNVWSVLANAQGTLTKPNIGSPDASTGEAQVTAEVSDANQLGTWSGFLDSASQAIKREGVTSDELDRYFGESVRILLDARSKVSEFEPQVNKLTQQLDEIGPAPADGEPAEALEITDRRDALSAKFAEADAKLKEARLAIVRASQIQEAVAAKRRDRFVRALTARSTESHSFSFWERFFTGFTGFSKGLGLLAKDSYAAATSLERLTPWKKTILPAALISSFLVLLYFRRWLGRVSSNLIPNVTDTRLIVPVQAFFAFCQNGVIGAAIPVVIYQCLFRFGLLTERLELLVREIAISSSILIAATSLILVIFSPNNSRLRIADLNDSAADNIVKILLVGLFLTGLVRVINVASIILVSPFEVSLGLSVVLATIVAVTALIVFWQAANEQQEQAAYLDTQSKIIRWRYLRMFLWILAVVVLIAIPVGYIALSEFLALQLIFGTMVVAVAWLTLRVLDAYQTSAYDEQQTASEGMGDQYSGSPQLGVIGFGISKLLVYLAALVMLLLPWGYRTSDFFELISRAFFGFQIGGLNFSLSTLLLAFTLFAIGYTVTVALRSWLNNRFLPTTSLDAGLSNSISTIFGYLGFILAAVLAITAAGFDLTSLAFIAGALSLGVGFGLQSIINNFVSGLILLTERPITAGDWVVTKDGEGTVKRISVRSTEIETFDRATVLVPNSTLITESVTNWTHANKMGRIIVPIGVGYDSDPDQVREILMQCVEENPGILKKPEPVVYFIDFGADALIFQLRAFLADINYSLSVQSELRFAILRKLRAAKIEIPYPQRDIHIKSGSLESAKPATVRPRKGSTTKKS